MHAWMAGWTDGWMDGGREGGMDGLLLVDRPLVIFLASIRNLAYKFGEHPPLLRSLKIKHASRLD